MALIWAAALIFAVKCIEFLLDSHVLFDSDSCSFLLNGLGQGFIPVRSYIYGDIIVRCIAAPLHYSLRAVIAAQCLMGGVTAWLMFYGLISFLGVRNAIAIVCALIFVLDPVQIFHEHLILTETMAMLAASLFITSALYYLKNRQWWILLVAISLLGAGLASLRVVYVPVVGAAAVVVPLIAWFPTRQREKWVRSVAVALLVSCGSTLLFQAGYRHLTGHLAGREPAYHYWTGCFLLASVSPIIEARDSKDARVARVIAESKQSYLPLGYDFRAIQLWNAAGLINRLKTAFGGDERLTNNAAEVVARTAIRRDPAGFIILGLRTYFAYWTSMPKLRELVQFQLNNVISSSDSSVIVHFFGIRPVAAGIQGSIGARYYLATRCWYVFLLVSPVFLVITLFLRSTNWKEVLFLLIWTCLLFTATCLGAAESSLRYLHPFSFVAIAGAGVLGETATRRSLKNGSRINSVEHRTRAKTHNTAQRETVTVEPL